jgi:hypothetical protein
MKVEGIREAVHEMRLTTPEAQLLGSIALTLVDLLESVTDILESVNTAVAASEKLAS